MATSNSLPRDQFLHFGGQPRRDHMHIAMQMIDSASTGSPNQNVLFTMGDSHEPAKW